MKERMLARFSRFTARVGWGEAHQTSARNVGPDSQSVHEQSRADGHTGRTAGAESVMLQAELVLKESDSLRYLLRRPSFLRDSPPALLCFLHDYDQAAPSEPIRALTRHGPFAGSTSAFLDRFVIVAPQLPCSADAWCLYGGAIEEIIEHEVRRHECDRSQIFLTGFSIGANGAFELAHIQRDFWCGVWAVDPTRISPVNDRCPVWLSIGALSRPQLKEWVRKLALEPASARHARRVWEDVGLDHVTTARRAYEQDKVYEWLLAQGR